jgi:hypothetical protein
MMPSQVGAPGEDASEDSAIGGTPRRVRTVIRVLYGDGPPIPGDERECAEGTAMGADGA